MVEETSLIERYLELGLRLGKLVPGFVDSYYGPPELAANVDQEPPMDATALRGEASALLKDMDSVGDGGRRRWLLAQLRGLETTARVLAGEQLSYVEEVEGCYGVRPTLVSEDVFAEAHDRLAQAFPGRGPIVERYRRWLESQVVPSELVLPALRVLIEELRERTHRFFSLPEGESLEVELVSGKPWLGFAAYEGGFRGRVSLNSDLPVWSFGLLEFVTHEAYPGHHTEAACKEKNLVEGRGYLEETVRFVGAMQSLLSEGLAQLAMEVVLGAEADAVAGEHLRRLGLSYKEETVGAVRLAKEALGHVRPNILYLVDERSMSPAEARAYAHRWMLEPREYVDNAIETLIGRAWRSYESCYTEGLRLCRNFVRNDPSRFKRLLTEQLTIADLT